MTGSDLTADREVGRDADGQVRVAIRLRGLVDLGTQPILEEALDEAMAVPAVRAIDVDLSGLTLLDSTGIATILHAYRLGATLKIRVRAHGSTGMVHRVLDITGVLAVLSGED
ncbi:STAS domain-containing protein [Dactylosporangium sp. NPDC051541]|uniref:STAS domain-containing protein n=1 Tax=Dactylosporangium sp. NPDC051541 TaxID=3363977 RepID=UPI003791AF01